MACDMTGVATLHVLVLIALVPSSLVLAVRFLAGGNDRRGVLIDAGLIVVIASILWTAGFGTKTVYRLVGYSVLLAVTLVSLIVRWWPTGRARRSREAKGP